MNPYDNTKRIFYYDVLRVLAILLVILSHVCKTFAENFPIGSLKWISSATFADIAVMGVPIFLMISGALLLNREYTLTNFMKRRFSRVLIPFVLWFLLLPIWKMIFLGKAWTVDSYIHLLFIDQYWFVWMLIGAYLLIPIINSFIREYDLNGLAYLLIIWFISMILLKDLSIDVLLKISEMNDFGWTGLFAGYFGFFPLGYYLSVKKFNISDRTMYLIGLVMLIIFSIINIRYTLINSPKHDVLVYYGYRRIVSTLQAIGLFLFIKYFSQSCEKTGEGIKNKIYSFFRYTSVSRIILSISVCSYGMYLLHYFWLYPLQYISKNIVPIFSSNTLLLPLVLIFISLMSWLTVLLLNKIPILKYFSGAH